MIEKLRANPTLFAAISYLVSMACPALLMAGEKPLSEIDFDLILVHPDTRALPTINEAEQYIYVTEPGLMIQRDSEGSERTRLDWNDFVTIGGNDWRVSDVGHIALIGMRPVPSEWEILRLDPDQDASDLPDATVIAYGGNDSFESLMGIAGVADNGSVAFLAEVEDAHRSVYRGDGTGDIHDIGSYTNLFPDPLFPEPTTGTPVANQTGLVAAVFSMDPSAIVGLVGEPPAYPTLDDYILFDQSLQIHFYLSENDLNKVAFMAFDGTYHIELADGETSQLLATDVLSNTELTLNDLDEVVYIRENFNLPPWRREIVITDGKSEKVIAKSGDVLDGLVVLGLTLGPHSLNNSRRVSFVVTYEVPVGLQQTRRALPRRVVSLPKAGHNARNHNTSEP